MWRAPTRGAQIPQNQQVALALLVADLVDPDPAQPGEPVDPGHRVRRDPGDDRPHGAPRDPHQFHHRALRARHRQPGHLIIEVPGVTGAVTRPRHRRDDHPVHPAGHPRRVGLQHRPHRSQIQRPPPPPTLPGVITRTAQPAHPTPPPLPTRRAHMSDHQLMGLVELDPLHHRLLDPEQPSPYPAVAHAVPRPRSILSLVTENRRQGTACRPTS